MKKLIFKSENDVIIYYEKDRDILDLQINITQHIVEMLTNFGTHTEETSMLMTKLNFVVDTDLGEDHFEFNPVSRGFYISRSATGGVHYERDELLSFKIFEIADLTTLRMINPTNDYEANEVDKVLIRIYREHSNQIIRVAKLKRKK